MLKHLIKQKLTSIINNVIDRKLDSELERRLVIIEQINQFKSAEDNMLASHVESLTVIDDLVIRIEKLGISLVKEKINIEEFVKWINDFPEIIDHYKNLNDVKIQKSLEHFLTMKYLNISSKDVLIDIAAAGSPYANILKTKKVVNIAYIQDLVYKEGINGNIIGGNAGDIAVVDGFADVLTLHCAFECFQDDSDITFIREASRILNSNGRLGIIPLYLDNIYFVKSGPLADRRFINVEKEAKWIWRDDNFKEELFSRHYSPESFKNRIYNNSSGLQCEIIHFTNLDEIRAYFLGQRIYCNFMFRAFKE